jgi:hypothetical protein
MSYKTYQEARTGWLPMTANVIAECGDDDWGVIVYAWDGHLSVLRLVKLSVGWDVSVDYCEPVEDIRELAA